MVELNRTESDHLSSAQYYGRCIYTASAILTAYSVLITLRRS